MGMIIACLYIVLFHFAVGYFDNSEVQCGHLVALIEILDWQ